MIIIFTFEFINKIKISKENYDFILKHCIRKLNKEFEEDETPEQQAFGVIGGREVGDELIIEHISALKKNYRLNKSVSTEMTNYLEDFASPGELDIEKRGWVVEPKEFKEVLEIIDDKGLEFIGTYHMHHDNSWYSDVPKDVTSILDKQLAKGSKAFMFIAYISSENKHSLKAFYEAVKEVDIYII
ncbi:hypothetical protein ACQPU1_12900 [Clostridium paraputrificum]|uniref:hypothetical protein n=1 Tax=Clostridium paraputrificum TaxID=29363 RepID=UPI003D331A5D